MEGTAAAIILVLVLSLILATASVIKGCEPEPDIMDYTCNKEQMEIVEKQTKWCNANTNYISSHCYRSAMDRNCERKIKETN